MRYLPGHKKDGSARPVLERFWEKVDKTDDCWLWLGHRSKHGYGQLGNGTKRLVYAHRFSYELHQRPLEAFEVLHHTCGNSACVNPDHVQPMTQSEHAKLHYFA